MDLLCVPKRFGLLLLGSGELGAQISTQPGLLGEAVPFHLLLVEEPGLLPATSDKGLKENQCRNTKTYEETRKREERLREYLTSGNDDVAQDAPGLV